MSTLTGKKFWQRETSSSQLQRTPRGNTGSGGRLDLLVRPGVCDRRKTMSCRRSKRMKMRLLKFNQVQQLIEAPQQSQSTPVTPPVVQGHVPAELLPPTQIPSFVDDTTSSGASSLRIWLHHHLHLGHLLARSHLNKSLSRWFSSQPTARAFSAISTISAINS